MDYETKKMESIILMKMKGKKILITKVKVNMKVKATMKKRMEILTKTMKLKVKATKQQRKTLRKTKVKIPTWRIYTHKIQVANPSETLDPKKTTKTTKRVEASP